jgi:hypothetical protein
VPSSDSMGGSLDSELPLTLWVAPVRRLTRPGPWCRRGRNSGTTTGRGFVTPPSCCAIHSRNSPATKTRAPSRRLWGSKSYPLLEDVWRQIQERGRPIAWLNSSTPGLSRHRGRGRACRLGDDRFDQKALRHKSFKGPNQALAKLSRFQGSSSPIAATLLSSAL